MENAPALAAAADSSDPRTGLRAVAALRRLLEQLEALQVDNAREKGWSWQEIAEILGVSRQAVHKKHARRAGLSHAARRARPGLPVQLAADGPGRGWLAHPGQVDRHANHPCHRPLDVRAQCRGCRMDLKHTVN